MSDFAIRARWDRSAYDPGADPSAWLLIEIEPQARAEQPLEKVPADIVMILDTSGSMKAPDRYPVVRKALIEMAQSLAPEDRLAVVIFSTRADTVLHLVSGGDALGKRVMDLVASIDQHPLMYGGGTRIAPALGLALDELDLDGRPGAVRRVYALTDGELHDFPAAQELSDRFAGAGVELHFYGFGPAFNVEQIAALTRHVPGGTAKPLVETSRAIETFRHLARRSAELVARDLNVQVRLAQSILPGDGFRFRPHDAWLGPMMGHTLTDLVPSVELGRLYSYLIEMRLSEAPAGTQPVASVTLTFDGRQTGQIQRERVEIVRGTDGRPDPDVQQARDLCIGLRDNDPNAQIQATIAKLELAVKENRDPNYIAALRRHIRQLWAKRPGNRDPMELHAMSPWIFDVDDGVILQDFSELDSDFEVPNALDALYLKADESTDMENSEPPPNI